MTWMTDKFRLIIKRPDYSQSSANHILEGGEYSLIWAMSCYIGMCCPKGYGFSAVLVINRVSIIAILPPLW